MILARVRWRAAMARAVSAAATSATSTCGPSTGRETIAPAAPAANAWPTKWWPSCVVPGMATNKSPGPTSRLSKVTPATSNDALALPPQAASISALVHSGLILAPPCAAGAGRS